MPAVDQLPPLLPCIPENIPKQLRDAKRWAPWAAPWDPVREKYGKVPHRSDRVTSGLSNGSTVGWVSFDQALAAYQQHPDLFAGIGYLMTDQTEVTGVDLDHCIKDGVIEPWAAEIIAKLDSYTEISPSGTGLHVMLAGELKSDWSVKFGEKQAKQPGIDVYGASPRFLTFTGVHVAGSPKDLRPREEALAQLEKTHRKSKEAAKLHVLPLPDTHDVPVPAVEDLDLSYQIVDFLTLGPEEGADRSGMLIRTGVELAAAGLSPEQAFALMTANEHTWDIALDKRGYDETKAQEYLWTHHCRRGAEIRKADEVLTLDSFPMLDPLPVPADPIVELDEDVSDLLGPSGPEDDFVNLDAEDPPASRDLSAVAIKQRFQFESLSAFLKRPPPKWIIKGVLPQAALAVVFGASGSGKTFFALDMAVSVATGRAWRGVPVVAGGVAYVVAEGAGGFVDRAHAYCRQHDLEPSELPLHILADSPNLMQNVDVTDLILSLRACGPLSVIYMDTYARVMGNGNENEAQDVNRVVRNCALIHKATGAIVVLIHHSGKDAANGARGSSALRAAADAEIEVKKLADFRTATITKMKDGADDATYRFRLQNVVIGWDEDGDDRASCVVEHIADTEQLPASKAGPTGRARQHIMALMETYYPDVEVEREEFILFAKSNALEANDPNWKMKITKPLDSLVRNGFITEVSGRLRIPKDVQ